MGGRGCGGRGEGRGNTALLSEKAESWAGEGRHAATSRPAPGWPQAGPVAGEFFLSLRLWNCFCSQPEQGSRGQTREQGLELVGIPSTGPGRRSPWVDADGLACFQAMSYLHPSALRTLPVSSSLASPAPGKTPAVPPNLKDKRKVVSQRALEAKENLVQRRVSYKMAQE